jgi:hypothetical protein
MHSEKTSKIINVGKMMMVILAHDPSEVEQVGAIVKNMEALGDFYQPTGEEEVKRYATLALLAAPVEIKMPEEHRLSAAEFAESLLPVSADGHFNDCLKALAEDLRAGVGDKAVLRNLLVLHALKVIGGKLV